MPEPCIQEPRLASLESKTASQDTSIIYLGDQIKDLVSQMKWQNRMLIVYLLGAVAFLFKIVLGGG